MGIPRISWNESFDQAAAESGLTAQGVLAIAGRQIFGAWHWQRLGERIQCANGCAVWTVQASDIKPFGNAE